MIAPHSRVFNLFTLPKTAVLEALNTLSYAQTKSHKRITQVLTGVDPCCKPLPYPVFDNVANRGGSMFLVCGGGRVGHGHKLYIDRQLGA